MLIARGSHFSKTGPAFKNGTTIKRLYLALVGLALLFTISLPRSNERTDYTDDQVTTTQNPEGTLCREAAELLVSALAATAASHRCDDSLAPEDHREARCASFVVLIASRLGGASHVPYDSRVAFARDDEALRAAMAVTAEYLPNPRGHELRNPQ